MFARTQLDGVWLGGGYVPTAADWVDLDRKVFEAVNGDRGGTWAPTSAITFTANFQITGPLLVAYGGILTTPVTLSGDDNWPEYEEGHPFRKRKILHSCLRRASSRRRDWLVVMESASIQSVALGVQPTDRSEVITPSPLRFDVDVHDRATLKTAKFNFRVPVARDVAPYSMPKFRVSRLNQDGEAEVLGSTDAGSDAEGWQSPEQATSGAAWHANGAAQSFTYVCDQNNVIDTSLYCYIAEVLEEGVSPEPVHNLAIDGITRREQKRDVRLATTEPLVGGAQGAMTIDGVAVATGDRILIKNGALGDETRYHSNAIWIAHTVDPWTRAIDSGGDGTDPAFRETASDFTPGFFVFVTEGVTNKNTVWELVPPYPQNVGGNPDTSDVHFAELAPRGNQYITIELFFDGIADMRPQ